LTDVKIPWLRLYERRSKSTDLSYLSGKLGDLRVLCFRESGVPDAELYGADGRWQCFVAPGDQRVERRQRPALALGRPGK
jgi:hypothetical protein